MNFFRTILFIIILSIPGFAQDYPPSMDYSAMMNIRYYENNGGFLIETVPIFFPPGDMSSVEFEVATSSGETKFKKNVYVNKWQQFPIVDGIRPQVSGIVKLKQEGDFVLRVNAAGKEITRIPFKMSVQNSGDPFNPQSTYTKEGPWSKLGYFSVNPERAEDAITFNWWGRIGELPGSKGGMMTVQIIRSGKEVAVSKGSFISKKSWQSASRKLKQSGSNFRNNFTLADLTQNDGTYEIVLKAGDKTIRTYIATVSGGKLQHHPRSAMDYSPHADYITPKVIYHGSGSASNNKMLDAYWVETE